MILVDFAAVLLLAVVLLLFILWLRDRLTSGR